MKKTGQARRSRMRGGGQAYWRADAEIGSKRTQSRAIDFPTREIAHQ